MNVNRHAGDEATEADASAPAFAPAAKYVQMHGKGCRQQDRDANTTRVHGECVGWVALEGTGGAADESTAGACEWAEAHVERALGAAHAEPAGSVGPDRRGPA